SVRMLRDLRSRPGRPHRSPQAFSVAISWAGQLKSVAAFRLRSTWASPSTSRRIFRPRSKRSERGRLDMAEPPWDGAADSTRRARRRNLFAGRLDGGRARPYFARPTEAR